MPTYDELQAQVDQLQKQANEAKQKEKNEAIADMKAKIKKYDITATDLGLAAKPAVGGELSAEKKAGAPKYKNPETGETWTGKGPQPKWLKAALADGKGKEQFAIEAAGQ